MTLSGEKTEGLKESERDVVRWSRDRQQRLLLPRKKSITSGLLVQAVLGYEFRCPQLLSLAFTNAGRGITDNERLELIGDSALSLLVSSVLNYKFPWFKEGELSRIRSDIVSKTMLYKIAKHSVVIGRYLAQEGGTKFVSNLVESLLGSVYIDGGFNASYFTFLNIFTYNLGSAHLLFVKDPRVLLGECAGRCGSLRIVSCYLRKYTGFSLVKWLLYSRNCNLVGISCGECHKIAGQRAASELLRVLITGNMTITLRM